MELMMLPRRRAPFVHRPVAAVLAMWCCLLAAGAAAAGVDPDPRAARALLERVRAEMVVALADPAVRQDARRIRALVDDVLVPHVEFGLASRLVLAEHWQRASESQRAAFIAEFRLFLVRFYSAALAGYVKNSATIPEDLMQFSDDVEQRGERRLVVHSTVRQPGADAIPVNYRLVHVDTGWKVVDVTVSGVSMVKTYRGSFVTKVERDGLDALIAYLGDRNHRAK